MLSLCGVGVCISQGVCFVSMVIGSQIERGVCAACVQMCLVCACSSSYVTDNLVMRVEQDHKVVMCCCAVEL